MVKIVTIIETGHSANATEEFGPFSDTLIGDIGKFWDFISPLLHFTYAWPHVKSTRKNHDVWKAIIAFCGHLYVKDQ